MIDLVTLLINIAPVPMAFAALCLGFAAFMTERAR